MEGDSLNIKLGRLGTRDEPKVSEEYAWYDCPECGAHNQDFGELRDFVAGEMSADVVVVTECVSCNGVFDISVVDDTFFWHYSPLS